ncbi:MAG: hypothetical protein CMB73_01845 [Euryarchaeota archaeon]|nr:hypothetical protein [Euryarchaeota archaeon]
MKLKSQIVVLLIASLSLSGCIGENDVSSPDDGPTWINDTGDGNSTWNIELDNSEWLEIYSSYAQVLYWDEYGNGSREEYVTMTAFTISEDSEGWLVPGFSPIFGGNYSGCYVFQDECKTNHAWGDQGFEVISWSVIYRVHEV